MPEEHTPVWKHRFHQNGYLVSGNIFSQKEILAAQEAQKAFYRGEYDQMPAFPWPKPRISKHRQRRHPYSCFFQKNLAKLGENKKLLNILTHLGDGTVRRWFDQLLWNEPISKTGSPTVDWHIEKSRWQTCSSPLMATAWIPLEPINQEMGPITMQCPKTHKTTPLLIPDGGVGIFHWNAIHGNPPNHGNRPRKAIAIHYALGNLTYQKNGTFQHLNERFCRKKNADPDFTDERVCPLLAAFHTKKTFSLPI